MSHQVNAPGSVLHCTFERRRHRRDRTRGLLILTAAFCFLLSGLSAFAQEVATVERGMKPERAFQIGQIDHINLLNGGLQIAIPIGQRYPVGGGLSYGLTLYYEPRLWEHDWVFDPAVVAARPQAFPAKGHNAGFGWRLSFGQYVPSPTSGWN